MFWKGMLFQSLDKKRVLFQICCLKWTTYSLRKSRWRMVSSIFHFFTPIFGKLPILMSHIVQLGGIQSPTRN